MESGWTLYDQYFKGNTKYDYDERINDYNWIALFLVQVAFYSAVQVLARVYAPEPGPKKHFIEKGKLSEYHFYYFQYTSFVHAIIGIVADTIILLTCGYRYNQGNHVAYMLLMVHSTAYFVYDSVVEYMSGSDDFLTNLHHICVVSVSIMHLISKTSGFEFLILHLMAESSNPFVIIRTMLKISGRRSNPWYKLNERLFALIFIVVRMFLTPLALIYIFEADQVIYATKFGVTFVLYVQLFWCYRVLNLVGEALKDAFPKDRMVLFFHRVTELLCKDKSVKMKLGAINFILIFVVPHVYYGYVRQTLFNFY